jgi:hypothetical protein
MAGGQVIVREYGIVIIDEAVAGADEVMALLDQAAASAEGRTCPGVAYVMANLTLDVDAVSARELARYAISVMPEGFRFALIHARRDFMVEMSRHVVEEMTEQGVEATACATLNQAEAWLRQV